MNEKGQVQLSFGVIFSIIIIVATLAVAAYVIYTFWESSKDVECKLFWQDLQKKVDSAWQADDAISDVFTESVTADTKKVCFGYMNQTTLEGDRTTKDEITNYAVVRDNLFYYPRNACGKNKASYNLKHIKTDSFFCVNVASGKASVKISRESFDNSVKLSK